MSKCKYYKIKTVATPVFGINGECWYENREVGFCTRDKSVETYCHGNKTRCEFGDEEEGKWR